MTILSLPSGAARDSDLSHDDVLHLLSAGRVEQVREYTRRVPIPGLRCPAGRRRRPHARFEAGIVETRSCAPSCGRPSRHRARCMSGPTPCWPTSWACTPTRRPSCWRRLHCADWKACSFPPLVALYARARLRLVMSWAWLLAPSPSLWSEHRACRDSALADLHRCGFTEEASLHPGRHRRPPRRHERRGRVRGLRGPSRLCWAMLPERSRSDADGRPRQPPRLGGRRRRLSRRSPRRAADPGAGARAPATRRLTLPADLLLLLAPFGRGDNGDVGAVERILARGRVCHRRPRTSPTPPPPTC